MRWLDGITGSMDMRCDKESWEPKASDPIWKGRVNERSTGHKVKPENDEQIIHNRTTEFS